MVIVRPGGVMTIHRTTVAEPDMPALLAKLPLPGAVEGRDTPDLSARQGL